MPGLPRRSGADFGNGLVIRTAAESGSAQARLCGFLSYAGAGAPRFVLACRRQGVFCVDLQRAPLEGAPMVCAEFSKLPHQGLSTLPALFWNWTEQDAEAVRQTMRGSPWHGSLHGGHPKLTSWLDDDDVSTREWDAKFPSSPDFTREILNSRCNPWAGFGACMWDALAAEIESAPPSWRWWLRRHPASSPCQDAEFRRLLSVHRPNVMIEEASAWPLAVLLRHVSVVVCPCLPAQRWKRRRSGVPRATSSARRRTGRSER